MQELAHFVGAHWAALPDATGQTYYINQLTGRTQWVEPLRPSKVRETPAPQA